MQTPASNAPKSKSKLTDAERHKRFVETAKKVEVSDEPKAFDKAFIAVADRNYRKNTS